MRSSLLLRLLVVVTFGGLTACEGERGPAGVGADGTSCTISGNTITCEDGTTATIIDGVDGSSCTVTDTNGTKTITCDDGTSIIIPVCWDLNENGTCEVASEDTDGDGDCSVADCIGGIVEPADNTDFYGGKPLSRRVHAVHNGSNLNFPNETVAHADGVPGRNWNIAYPQDVRNCETCHPAADTSGSWMTGASRLPCMGCHDSEAAQAHFKLMTWDPTPTSPWNGDEEESCGACHNESNSSAATISENHGTATLLSQGEYEACEPGQDWGDRCGKSFVTVTIDPTGTSVDPSTGVVTIHFTVEDDAGDPVAIVDPVSGDYDLDFGAAKLVPDLNGAGYTEWVNYVWAYSSRSGSVRTGREGAEPANLTTNAVGDYTYVMELALADACYNPTQTETCATVAVPDLVGFEPNRTTRLIVELGGHGGPTGATSFDLVPDGTSGATVLSRAIVATSTCVECHGQTEFHGHGGDRLTVEECVVCHNDDAGYAETIDLGVMIHKIHAGVELATAPGADGIYWDDPATTADESADNGSYAYAANPNMEFPAVIENCTKCHAEASDATLTEGDAWKTNPTRDKCGSCHDNIDFTETVQTDPSFHGDPTSGLGGAQANDNLCAGCHPATGSPAAVTESHEWFNHHPRNISEFGVMLSVSGATGGGGTFFAAGDTPVVKVELCTDPDDCAGTLIDHTTVIRDWDGAEGCSTAEDAADNCPAPDGKFASASLFVHGPRANRNPALSTAARVEIKSTTTGPFDLSADGASLSLVVDGGKAIAGTDASGGDVLYSGMITVDVEDGTFVSTAAATAAEIVAWLNDDEAFEKRAIAYLENGYAMIRSRNLGDFYSLRLEKSAVNTEVFGNDDSLHIIGGYTASNNIAQAADSSGTLTPASNDPKAAWATDGISYTLDPVDDLEAGTYIVSVEIGDRGRVSGSDYATPTVGWTTFQVKTATVEKPIARNCDSCHQSASGEGFVLDFARHNKKFTDDASDQCGACHDYQSGH